MAILPICTYPEPVLKQEAEPIEVIDDDIRKLSEDMIETMYDAPGVGLAAPQVGRSCRMIVVENSTPENVGQALVIINPEIISASGEIVFEEACLSVIDYKANVTRANEVVIRGLDIDGQMMEITAEGTKAVVFQHEIDHLNGMLFIDHISVLKRDLYKRKLKKILKQREQEGEAA